LGSWCEEASVREASREEKQHELTVVDGNVMTNRELRFRQTRPFLLTWRPELTLHSSSTNREAAGEGRHDGENRLSLISLSTHLSIHPSQDLIKVLTNRYSMFTVV
jgi:hypothetical protein